MRIKDTFPWAQREEPRDIKTLLQWFRLFFADTATIINGDIGFGDGVDPDNMGGVWVTIPNTGSVASDVAVVHNLGVVPVGFILMVPPATGTINKGATPWTTSTIYIRCSTANQACTVFVLNPRLTHD
jgi:hypothetical protein